MNPARNRWLLWLLLCTSLVYAEDPKQTASSASSTPAKPAATGADEELLEFLGSVDDEPDEEWIDYLSRTDISKKANDKAPVAAEASSK